MEYDIDRDKVMQEFGLTILRFNNDEVLESTDVVISQIIKIIEANSKTKAV
jgi:very-short-patch-repair endonuclease